MSTPAPRKFLNPSSDRYKTPKPTWRRTGSSSQVSSSLRQPSSTQFARTPHFARPSRENIDDIDISFEDPSSPTDAKIRRPTRSVSGNHDDLIDGNDEDTITAQPSERPRVRSEDVFNIPTTRPSLSKDTIQDFDEGNFPQPTSKRLKTSSESARTRDTIIISSSGSGASNYYNEEQEQLAHHSTSTKLNSNDSFSPDSDLDENDIPSSPMHTLTTIPRFKAPAPPRNSTQQPAKPVFKPPLPSQLTYNATPLPETFSPSRRRGRRDYVPGGYADTVRNWVLELAAAESRPREEAKRTLRVADVRHDVEGRCAMAFDERGEEWLLVVQGQQSDAGSIRVGDAVEINGEGTSWRIALQGERANGGAKEATEGAGERVERSVNVSVLWKVKR